MVQMFVDAVTADASVSVTNNVLFLAGSDFQHENSNEWFKNRTCDRPHRLHHSLWHNVQFQAISP